MQIQIQLMWIRIDFGFPDQTLNEVWNLNYLKQFEIWREIYIIPMFG